MTTHNAPPVVYPLVRSRFQAVILAGIWFAGLLSVLLWLNAGHSVDWRGFLAAALVVFAGIAAFRGWKHSPMGQLVWDGQLWRWESQSYPTGTAELTLFVIADFQSYLLIKLQNQAHAGLWLWAEQDAFPARWLDLRRAVYCAQRRRDESHAPGAQYVEAANMGQTRP